MISGLYTALLLIVFLAIVAWAYKKDNKSKFNDMAAMPLKEDHQKKDEVNHE